MLLRFASAAVAMLLLAGCGASENADATVEDRQAATPLTCLEDAGLDAEQRAADLWRGFDSSGGLVRVAAFSSAAEARRAVRDATEVSAAQAGTYAVFGDAGDQSVVDAVAACLKG